MEDRDMEDRAGRDLEGEATADKEDRDTEDSMEDSMEDKAMEGKEGRDTEGEDKDSEEDTSKAHLGTVVSIKVASEVSSKDGDH